MKLSFVGAALLISVLRTDAQGYPGSQGYNVPTNYNPQLPESGPYVAAQVNYPRPEGYNSYSMGTYFGNPNPQKAPRQPFFFGDMLSTMSSVLGDSLNMMGDTLKKWSGAQSESYRRPYPYYSQGEHYSGPRLPPPLPPASGHVVDSAYPYNQLQPGNNQAGAPSNHYGGLPSRFVSRQVGASSYQYNDPSPPVASIQVTGASDSKNGLPPASSQLNVRVPVPPQNAM